jgi:hypothetical protein
MAAVSDASENREERGKKEREREEGNRFHHPPLPAWYALHIDRCPMARL